MSTPGWYNDDDDPLLARWHDGVSWTEFTLVKSEWVGLGMPPNPVGEPPLRDDRPLPRRRAPLAPPPLWVAGVVALIAAVLIVVSQL